MNDKSNRNPVWVDNGEVDVLPGSEARPTAAEPFERVIDRAVSRRSVLKGATIAGGTLLVAPPALLKTDNAEAAPANSGKSLFARNRRLTFETVPPGNETDVVVPNNYSVDVILRWGDPLTPDAPELDLDNQTGETQAQQFGYNADLVLWYPLPRYVRRSVERSGELDERLNRILGRMYPRRKNRYSRRALMVVNHEYTKAKDMFPDYDSAKYPTKDQTETEIEAHGFSIVELVVDRNGQWSFNRNSVFNRRSTGSTPMEITGPLRGHAHMQSEGDPTGAEVLGSFNNCAGGKTPWGTILTCEENFDQYFAYFDAVPSDIKALSERIPADSDDTKRGWEKHVDRFDLSKDPKEYNRFGYIVEIDPYNPNDKPKKRTALGRFKHEGAAANITRDRKVAIYSGDDARFEYVYKFVSDGTYNSRDRASNMDLLNSGTLYVARFDAGPIDGDDMGTGEWLPLVWEPGNDLDLAGFTSQADVLVNTRGAADVLGATPMDRPEDIEVSPKTGGVYIALTNNSERKEGDENETNPRAPNPHGHVIELIEDGNDAGALTFTWNILIKCGDPAQAHDARFGDLAGQDAVDAGVSPISDPDNVVHDDDGNLWIATDGQFFSGSDGFGQNDGVFAVPVEGADRGVLRQFLSGVPRGEVCSPEFSGDNRSFFCCIQHPNDGEAFDKIWPTDETEVSKPSLIAVRHNWRRKIGQ